MDEKSDASKKLILSSPATTASRKPYKQRPPGFFDFRIIAKEPARNHHQNERKEMPSGAFCKYLTTGL